ncbi:MAG TPA: glycosyltransferase family 4 protein, partial [Kofleriaceae bacterium]|nr:glycosyltransferase family 4 protein [Kofleriaceae bacterium]
MRHVLRALAAEHTVDVLVLRAGDQPYVERMGNARVLRVPVQDDDPAAQVNAFRRALRRQLDGAEYDVVHFRDGWSGIPVLEERERLRYAAVFDPARGPLADPAPATAEIAAELGRDEEACLLAADLVLVPHEPAGRFVAARGQPRRVHVVPPGVDVDQFDFEEPPDGPPRIVYVGELAPGRGIRILLRAMLDVFRRSDARLVLAGPITAAFDQTLRKAIADLGMAGRVELPGAIDHERVPALLAGATICVAPAAAELAPRPTTLYPTKLLEYMACRRAVVAPRRSTLGLLIDDGEHGLLFNPGDPLDLAAKLLRLLGDASLRQRLAAAGYERVRAQHTASATRRSLRAAYRALAQQSPWRERFAEPRAASEEATPRAGEAMAEVDTASIPRAGDGSGPWEGAAAGDETSVDLRSPEGQVQVRADDWVVEDTAFRRAVGWGEPEDEEEGTPVDVRRAPSTTPAIEARFAAGEVDVPSPAPEPS